MRFCAGTPWVPEQFAHGGLRPYDPMNAQIRRALKDFTRACLRGTGAPEKAVALPFERLQELPSGRAPWTRGGPACPRNALVAGAWFMLREVELATSRAALLEIFPGPAGEARATWHLPASKTDQRAEGVARTHYCSCTPGSRPSASCVVSGQHRIPAYPPSPRSRARLFRNRPWLPQLSKELAGLELQFVQEMALSG